MSVLTRITNVGVQAVGEVTGLNLSRDGRYILASSSGFDPNEEMTFRYDNQTGTRLPGFATRTGAAGIDLSGDGRYWTFVRAGTLGSPSGIGDFATQSAVASFEGGLRGKGTHLGAISDNGLAISYTFTTSSFPGPSDGYLAILLLGGSERRVPGVTDSARLSDDSISGAGERIVFEYSGSIYYADTAGGAAGFTQSPVLIAFGANASISTNGRYVVFESGAALVAQDTNPGVDIYLKDLQTGTLTLVSTASDGTPANVDSINAAVSGDGRYVVFASSATNLVANDTNGVNDIFLKDLATGQTTRLSVSNDGVQGNGHSSAPEISSDGSTVIFMSQASNLLTDDTNGIVDTFRVALGAGRLVNGDGIIVSDSYQLQTGERALYLEGPGPSFGNGNGLDNTLIGSAFDNTLRGLGGHDYVAGQGGNDRLEGGAGDDFLDGGDGNDLILGGDGNDNAHGGLGDDFIAGGEGDNPWLAGEAGRDTIVGGSGTDGIAGGDGDDPWLAGQGGVDYIYGGDGNDGISGGDGNDAWLAGEGGNDSIHGGAGDDVISGGAGDDPWLAGEDGNDYIMGGDGNDVIAGGAGDDFNLFGDDGSDFVFGEDGADRLFGGAGDDQLFGGAGDDVLFGNGGNDRLEGDAGADKFIVEGAGLGYDVVVDFDVAGGDLVGLSGSLYSTREAMLAAAVQAADGTYVETGGGYYILLLGIDKTTLTVDDFFVV